MKVLIIGGYGTFGFRIAERLSDEAGLEFIISGRNLDKANAACRKLSDGAAAKYLPLELDRNGSLSAQIAVPPDVIIDASGPFQAYAEQPVIDYALAHGSHYIDLSDDGAFVAGVQSREAEAIAADVALVSGLSTCPVLSAVGLRACEDIIGSATDVTIGIAPSPKAELGRNVVAAVANYAGQKQVAVRRNGARELVHGLTDIRSETICVPGDVPLPRLPFAVADAPDAWVLGGLTSVWTGAGTRPVWLHRLLVGMSHLVSWKLFPKLTPFAGLFHRVRGWFKFGTHRGGMFVKASNANDAASWHLVAEGDDGPYIPALPTVALIRKWARGAEVSAGAFAGHDCITRSDLQPEFDRLRITHGVYHDGADLPVYEGVMGDSYQRLHPAVAGLHRTGEGRHFLGECDITRGRNPLAHIICTIFGLPKSGRAVPVTLDITLDAKGEIWTRHFAGRRMRSHHRYGRGRRARLVIEQFGPIAIHMAAIEEAGNMRIATQSWSFFDIALPRFLRPGGDVYETEIDGRFIFHVDLQAPIIGRMVKYEGWLEPHEKSTKSE